MPSAEKSPESDKEIPILRGGCDWPVQLTVGVVLVLPPVLPVLPQALSTKSAAIKTPTLFRTGFFHKAVRPCIVVLLLLSDKGVTTIVTPRFLTPVTWH